MIAQLHAEICLVVARDNGLSVAKVKDRLFSYGTDLRLVVAPAARIYRKTLGDIKRSEEFDRLPVRERTLVNTWLRLFNFSEGAGSENPQLANNSDWTTVEIWECKECGRFEIEIEFDDMTEPICPICERDMELLPGVDSYVPNDYLVAELPYGTQDENTAYAEAQSHIYTRDDFGHAEIYDDHDTRDPNEEGAWAEYLEPEGMADFFSLPEYSRMLRSTQRYIEEADDLKLTGQAKWEYVRTHLRLHLFPVWHATVKLYKKGVINSPAMALICRRLITATRFDEEEMAQLTDVIGARSHVDGTELGYSLTQWIDQYDDEVSDDGFSFHASEIDDPSQEHAVARTWARRFERQLITHWAHQLGGVPQKEGKTVIWASAFRDRKDLLHNWWRFYLVARGTSQKDIRPMAERLVETGGWLPAPIARDVIPDGIVLADYSTLEWKKAAEAPLDNRHKDRLLPKLRVLWQERPALRLEIGVIGKALS